MQTIKVIDITGFWPDGNGSCDVTFTVEITGNGVTTTENRGLVNIPEEMAPRLGGTWEE